MPQPAIQELFDACRILFGEEVSVSRDFLRYLQPSGIKSAYWKRAKETHPDRAALLGLNKSALSDQFQKLTSAYETLHAVVRESNDLFLGSKVETYPTGKNSSDRNSREKSCSARPKKRDHFYTGGFPERRLLIGQFLYYSRIISWRMLIAAILWQRRHRPLVGQIAMERNMLTRNDVQQILRNRRIAEKFGESALRLGYISNFNLMAILEWQKKLHKPFGRYFVNQGVISYDELTRNLIRQRIHNRKFER